MSPGSEDESMGRDRLTGLPDRGYLDQRLKEEVHRAVRYEQPFTLVAMQVDDFTSIVDAFGRSAGDALLVKLAYVLKQGIRESDVLVRTADADFYVILVQAGRDQAAAWAQRVREGFGLSFEGDRRFAGAHLSAGLCVCPTEAITAYTVMQQAETAMYEDQACYRPPA